MGRDNQRKLRLQRAAPQLLIWGLFLMGLVNVVVGKAPTSNCVAYYPLNGAGGPYPRLSGVCPDRADIPTTASASGTTVTTGQTGFGNAVSFSGSTSKIDTGSWKINSLINQMTVTARVKLASAADSGLVLKTPSTDPNQIIWGLYTKGATPSFAIKIGGSLLQATSASNLPSNKWVLLAGVYDGNNAFIYLNGTQRIGSSGRGSINEGTQNVVIGNMGVGGDKGFQGAIDDVRIYNYALTQGDINNLLMETNDHVVPTATVANASFTTSVLSPAFLSATSNTNGWGVTYQEWALSSSGGGGCTTVNIADPNSATTNVTFSDLDTYSFTYSVYDTLLCAQDTATVTTLGDAPYFLAQPPPNITVIQGSTASYSVNVAGFPLPSFDWQELRFISPPIGRRRTLEEGEVEGEEEGWGGWEVEYEAAKRDSQRAFAPEEEISYEHVLRVQTNATCSPPNVTTNCYDWVSTNQTTQTFVTPVGDATIVNRVFRLVAFNFVGTLISNPILLQLATGTPSGGSSGGSGDGGSDSTTVIAAVIPSVLGTLLLLCLCCCIVMAVLLFFLIRNRGQRDSHFPGIPPDYEEVIFGAQLQPLYAFKSKQEKVLSQLEELLINDESFALAFALGTVGKGNSADKTASALNIVFSDHGKGADLVEKVILDEVARVTQSATMFRANSFSSQIFKHFAILVAAPYLWKVLAPFVWDINEEAKRAEGEEGDGDIEMSRSSRRVTARTDMEVDPTKIDEAADPKVNTLQLWLTAQKIFSCISRSHRDVPEELARVLKCVHDAMEEKFPGEEFKAMGGFLFLRFICPALLAPRYFGVSEENPSPTAQRQLILVAKVIQNLANDTLPGTKEDYMQALNDFINNNREELKDFFQRLLEAERLEKADRDVPDVAKKNALAGLHNTLCENLEAIKAQLNGEGEQDLLNHLDAIAQMGPIPKNKSSAPESYQE